MMVTFKRYPSQELLRHIRELSVPKEAEIHFRQESLKESKEGHGGSSRGIVDILRYPQASLTPHFLKHL